MSGRARLLPRSEAGVEIVGDPAGDPEQALLAGGPVVRESKGFFPWGGVNTDSRKTVSGGLWFNAGISDDGNSKNFGLDPYMNFRLSTALQASLSFSVGNSDSQPLNSQSVIELIALPNVSVEPTAAGASADVDGMRDDEPMCMLMTVSVSAHARMKGRQ